MCKLLEMMGTDATAPLYAREPRKSMGRTDNLPFFFARLVDARRGAA